MGFLNNIIRWFRRETATTTAGTDANSTVSPARTGDTSFLMYGSDQTALNIATVYRCVKLLSESVANLPIQVMRLKGDLFAPDTSGRLNYLLNIQPDSNTNAFDFWVQVIQNVLLTGNAYIVPIYNPVTLEADRLALCNSKCVMHDTNYDKYTISDLQNSIYGVYDESEVIHIKGLTLNT